MKEAIPTDQKKSLDLFGVASNESNVQIANRRVLSCRMVKAFVNSTNYNFGDTSNGFQDERG